MSSAQLISHGRRWVAQENLLVDHDESSVQAVSFNYLRAEWKVPLQYPFSTPSVPRQYPVSTPSVPLQSVQAVSFNYLRAEWKVRAP